jgi:hypothetical protein
MLSAAEPGDRVEADEVIAQIETDKVFVSFIQSLLVSVFFLFCRFFMIECHLIGSVLFYFSGYYRCF